MDASLRLARNRQKTIQNDKSKKHHFLILKYQGQYTFSYAKDSLYLDLHIYSTPMLISIQPKNPNNTL